MNMPRVVIAEGVNTAGAALVRLLTLRGYRVTVLSRKPEKTAGAVHHVAWDGATLGPWFEALEGACGLVNLAGCGARENARESLSAASVLATALAACADGPSVWLQAGSLRIYGDERRTRAADELTAAGEQSPSQEWLAVEHAMNEAPLPQVRRAVYRLGAVLSESARSRRRVQHLVQWSKESPANRTGWLSWIHADDLARLLYWGLRMEIIAGPYNACVPEAVPLDSLGGMSGNGVATPWPGESNAAPESLVRAMPRRFLDIAYQFRNEDLAQVVGESHEANAPGEHAAVAAMR